MRCPSRPNRTTWASRQREAWGVVHWRDGDIHSGSGAVARTVACVVGERISAIEVSVRCVSETSVCVQGQHTVGRRRHQHGVQRVAIHICVVGQYATDGRGEGNIFQRRVAVVVRRGRIVGYADGDECGVSAALTVRDGVCQDHRADECSVRREQHVRAVHVRRAVGLRHAHECQHVAIGITVVGQH